MDDKNYPTLWDGVKGVCTVLIVGSLTIKLYNIPISLTVDFPTLLSLTLAIFSVYLSAMFYFKATDTSNKFYDNSYKFTRDIAQLLVKMESGFGEKLKNLDESYASVRGYLQSGLGVRSAHNTEETNKQLKEEMEEFKKAVEERNKIVEGLIERSQLEAADKDEITKILKNKESEIAALQNQIAKLSRRKTIDKVKGQVENKRVQEKVDFSTAQGRVKNFIKTDVFEELGGSDWIKNKPLDVIAKSFSKVDDSFPPAFINDLTELGMYGLGGLNREGAQLIRSLALDE